MRRWQDFSLAQRDERWKPRALARGQSVVCSPRAPFKGRHSLCCTQGGSPGYGWPAAPSAPGTAPCFSAVPTGLRFVGDAFPAMNRWANLCCAYGALNTGTRGKRAFAAEVRRWQEFSLAPQDERWKPRALARGQGWFVRPRAPFKGRHSLCCALGGSPECGAYSGQWPLPKRRASVR